MINHEKSKGIGIKPERVRQFISEIEQQATDISELKEVRNERNNRNV